MIESNSISSPYDLAFIQKPGYLLAKVTGETDSLEISHQYWIEIITEIEKYQPKKLMVWENFKTDISTLELFTLVKEICNYQQFLHIRIAFVDEHLDQYDRNKLGEMIATNRGFTCRVFSSFEEAESWLLKA
jgi:hypothetical protein